MTTTVNKTFRSGANRSLAMALAAGSGSIFGMEKLEFAAGILAANNPHGKVILPANFANEVVFIQVASSDYGDVVISDEALPDCQVAEARERHNAFQRRQALKEAQKPMPRRVGKTAKKGGIHAAKAKKAARAAEDRRIREEMRGVCGKSGK